MANGTTIQARIDEDTKEQAKQILDTLGIKMSELMVMCMKQVVLHKGIPFDVKIPNQITLDTHEKAKVGKELHTVSSIKELKSELTS